jgi:hypothetical protein
MTDMKQIILLAGVAALATAAPAFAKPDHSGHGKHGNAQGHGVGGCPPGLAKKGNGCMPPGQAKKLYNIGHRFPRGYNSFTPYNQIPYDVRRQYGLDPYGRYVTDQNYIYQVDPATLVVSRVLDAILR